STTCSPWVLSGRPRRSDRPITAVPTARSSATLAFADAALADRVNRAGHVPAEAEPLPRGGEPDLQGRAARRGHVHRGSPRPQATAIRTCPGPGSEIGRAHV